MPTEDLECTHNLPLSKLEHFRDELADHRFILKYSTSIWHVLRETWVSPNNDILILEVKPDVVEVSTVPSLGPLLRDQ
jgi:hypothetical protein